jgi:hypothetical protein
MGSGRDFGVPASVPCNSIDQHTPPPPRGTPPQEEEALDVLRVLSSALAGAPRLKALDLSDNALGEKGVRACADVLAGKVMGLGAGPARNCGGPWTGLGDAWGAGSWASRAA